MKKFVALFLAALMVMSLAACGEKPAATTGAAASSGAATTGAAASSGAATTAASTSGKELRFVTGGESGTYYAFGNVIAQHVTNNAGVKVVGLVGAGSQGNVNKLDDQEAELAFCQSDVMAYAYEGTNLFKDQGAVKSFSTLGALYLEDVQIVTTNPDIKTVADLKDKKVSIGAAGSGVYFNAIDVLGVYGLTENDIKPTYQSFGDSANDLKDGKIDAAFIVSGAPTTAIVDLATTNADTHLVSLDDAHVEELLKTSPYYAKHIITKDTYKTMTEDATTVAVGAVILVRDDVDETAVYNICKDIYDNAPNLVESHAKYGEVSVEYGASITSVPYHKGAAKYFGEKGVTVATK